MRRVLVGAGVVALLAGCGDPEPSSPTAADLEDVDLSPDHTISVDEDGYEPTSLEVSPGEVVLLVNEGDDEHTFTAEDDRFDTGRMQPGDETTLVLTEPGEVVFRDLEDPGHEGALTVLPRR
jgi:plastocyanin